MEPAAETVRMMVAEGIEVEIFSGGGTGTYNMDHHVPGFTDGQPGSYVFMDVQYLSIGGEDLTDDQVIYLNRTLNNARHNGLQIDFTNKDNWTLLLDVTVEDYNFHQIRSLTKALESEEKFLSKYEKTGKEIFLSKAATEKQKFLSRIDRFEDGDSLVPTPLPKDANRAALLLARQEARSALKDMARQARLQAKTLAKETTRSNSRGLSRNSAKQLAQEVRRQLKKSNRPSKGNQGKNK